MKQLDAAAVEAALDYPSLIDRLAEAFRTGAAVPQRQHHAVPVPGGRDGTLLVMPAWREGGAIGIKLVGVFPDNAAHGLGAVQGSYLLMSATTGVPLALLDAPALTARRTAAASALAARHLARPDAERLLVVGTGALAPCLAEAHAAVRRFREIRIWGRRAEAAAAVADRLRARGLPAEPTADLAAAAAAADVISCGTLSQSPVIRGEWLKPGSHLDLVGGYLPTMREADDRAVQRATVFVDTRGGALAEAGDIVDPIRRGILSADAIAGDLFDLVRGAAGRSAPDQVTLFKSVGYALEDLAAAELAVERS